MKLECFFFKFAGIFRSRVHLKFYLPYFPASVSGIILDKMVAVETNVTIPTTELDAPGDTSVSIKKSSYCIRVKASMNYSH